MYFNPCWGIEPHCEPAANHAGLNVLPLLNVAPLSESTVTVLRSVDHSVNKRYYLDDAGTLHKQSYQNAYKFDVRQQPVNNIEELASLLSECSQKDRDVLVRGLPAQGICVPTQRKKDHFPEHPEGTPWVMLDFDDIAVPEAIDPLSMDAIEWVIAKLPSEFHNVSYFYQHSNSAGILKSDGQPLKAGLNVHLFFWLQRRIPGKQLSAHLNQHCMDTGFYTLGENQGGSVDLWFGIDPAPIRSEVQPHFVALPTLDPGVLCRLAPEQRQGLIKKGTDDVDLPPLPENIVQAAHALKVSLVTTYKREHGYIEAVMQTRTSNGTASTRYYCKAGQGGAVRGGRSFKGGEQSADKRYLTLYFNDEGSPGSWYVRKDQPHMGVRHGDGSRLPLKELSIGAHEYVRDQLQWFWEVPQVDHDLLKGYLPEIAGFAQAKVNLILAPTGSGKTTAAINWISQRMQRRKLIVYTAPTIALVSQMYADLREAQLQPRHYQNLSVNDLRPRDSGVIVTTNESLPRIINMIEDTNNTCDLIFDEIHMALDEFAKQGRKLKTFETAMVKAGQTLLLTGTLTDVQRNFLVETVKNGIGAINADTFCCHEFQPAKQNPLEVWPLASYDSELAKLMADMKAKRDANQALPRCVLLLDTSRMAMYRNLIESYGLSEEAEIVSRPDCTPDQIEQARISTKPLLISSPLFGLGLNFSSEPDMLWARFDHVNADTNQIIQSVNRANRGEKVCDVRIFGNRVRKPFSVPAFNVQREEVKARVQEEGSLIACLEEHLTLDRVTYRHLRDSERDSGRALNALIERNALQNFTVIEKAELVIDKAQAEVVKLARKSAKAGEVQKIIDLKIRRGEGTESFVRLDRVRQEWRDNHKSPYPRVDREFENEQTALVMSICDMNELSPGKIVSLHKIRVLFGETEPWLSERYQPGQCPEWAQMVAEKTEHVIGLIRLLQRLQAGEETAQSLSVKLTRGDDLRKALLSLASGEDDYHRIGKHLNGLKDQREKVRRSGGRKAREEVDKLGLALLRDLFQPMGIHYGKKTENGREVTDLERPAIPRNWNLEEMIWRLERQVQRFRSLPVEQDKPVVEAPDDEYVGGVFSDPPKPRQLCVGCKFFHENRCVQGEPLDWQSARVGDYTTTCRKFRVMPEPLVARLR